MRTETAKQRTVKTVKTTRYIDQLDGFEYNFLPVEDTILIEEIPAGNKTLPEGGYKAKYLVQDTDPESPDKWGDNALFLVHYHRDFWIENKEVSKDILAELYYGHKDEAEFDGREYWIFWTAALIHSGVWLKLSRGGFSADPGGWDTSHCGAVLCSKKEFPTREKALQAAESLIDTWNQYLSGEVFGCVSEYYDKDKNIIEGKGDSCWGFYGLEYAKESLEKEF